MPIEKEVTGIHKNGEEVTKNMSYILQFIDGTRIMASLLSNLVNNLSEGIHRIKCKFGHDDKKNVKLAELRAKHATFLLNRQDHLIELKMILYNTIVYVATKNINRFNEKFKKRIFNTNKFSNRDNNKLFNVCEEMFILMNI